MVPHKVIGAAKFVVIKDAKPAALDVLRATLEQDNRSYVIADAAAGGTVVGIGERFADLTLPAPGDHISFFHKKAQTATVREVRAHNALRGTLDLFTSLLYTPPDPVPAALAELGAVDVWQNVPL